MITVIIRHKVKNYSKWKAAFDGFKKFRKASGEKSAKLGHIAGAKNNLLLQFRWDSLANAKKFLRSKELQAAMMSAGVLERPEAMFVEDR